MLPDTLIGVRDRALILVGFAGAFRRSELVGLDVRSSSEKYGSSWPGSLLRRITSSRTFPESTGSWQRN
jgi:site-specific recombinase XerC